MLPEIIEQAGHPYFHCMKHPTNLVTNYSCCFLPCLKPFQSRSYLCTFRNTVYDIHLLVGYPLNAVLIYLNYEKCHHFNHVNCVTSASMSLQCMRHP